MLAKLQQKLSQRARLTPIGMDIGPRHVTAAQLEQQGDRWKILRVTSLKRREVEEGTTVVGGFARRLGETMRQAGYQGKNVIAGLSIPELKLHPLDIPTRGDLAEHDKFCEAVNWEMDRVGGIEAGLASTSHWRLPDSDTNKTTAIGAAADKETINQTLQMVTAANMNCEMIDATACGLTRLGSILRRGRPDETNTVWAILDIGHRMSRLTLCLGEAPVLVRTLGHGSQNWTERIANSLGLSEEAAEVHKIDHGIAIEKEVPDPDSESTQPEISEMILDILRPEIDCIVNEIERSYEYIMRCYPERAASGLFVVGGGADLKGLCRNLTERLGVTVERIEHAMKKPGCMMTVAANIHQSLSPFAAAIGLAIEPDKAEHTEA